MVTRDSAKKPYDTRRVTAADRAVKKIYPILNGEWIYKLKKGR